MPATEALLDECGELISTDGRQDWARRESCARAIFRGVAPEAWMRELRLRGALPHGHIGEALAQATLDDMLQARAAVTTVAKEHGWLLGAEVRTEVESHAFVVRGQSWSLQVERLRGAPVQLLWCRAKSKHHRVALWVRHIMWSLALPGSHSIEVPLGNKTAQPRAAVDVGKAAQRLERLLDYAIAATSVPLPIDPKVVTAWGAGADEADRLAKVRAATHGDRFVRGIMQDAASALVFSEQPWSDGPTLQVEGAAAPVPTGLDALAAEIGDAMEEDGW
jgi:exonuclease V gamma subunit